MAGTGEQDEQSTEAEKGPRADINRVRQGGKDEDDT